MPINITAPDDFAEAEFMKFYHPLRMYFLWYGGDSVKGYDYEGNHILDLDVPDALFGYSVWQAKIAVSRYCRDFEEEKT